MEHVSVKNREESQEVSPLLKALREQKGARLKGRRPTHDQTRYIFETNTIGITDRDDFKLLLNKFRIEYRDD